MVYAAGGGIADAQTITLSPIPAAYVTGMSVRWLPTAANATTTPTLNINGLGPKTITKNGTSPVAASDLTTTAVATAIYDGTNFQLQNPQTSTTGGSVTNVGAPPDMRVINPTTIPTFAWNQLPNNNNPLQDAPFLYVPGSGYMACGWGISAPVLNNIALGCGNAGQGVTASNAAGPTSTSPGYGTSAGMAAGLAAIEFSIRAQFNNREFITGRPSGLSGKCRIGNTSAGSVRIGCGWSHVSASSAANLGTCATTTTNPVCYDTLPAAMATAFVGYSSSSGSYGGSADGNWVFVVSDASCTGAGCSYIDLGVAFAANTQYELRTWEDTAGTYTPTIGVSCGGITPCFCGAVAVHAATIGTFVTACTSSHAPATAVTTMNFIGGYAGNGLASGGGLWGPGMAKGME